MRHKKRHAKSYTKKDKKNYTKRYTKRHTKRKNKQKGGFSFGEIQNSFQSTLDSVKSNGSNYFNGFKDKLTTNFSSLKSGVMGRLCGMGGTRRKHRKH